MSGTAIVLVYTLYGDPAVAQEQAGAMVQAGFAACANILPMTESCYMWEGAFERQREYPVLFKTSAARREALMQRIGETHPYDLPAILSWTADALPGYARWVGDMTQEP